MQERQSNSEHATWESWADLLDMHRVSDLSEFVYHVCTCRMGISHAEWDRVEDADDERGCGFCGVVSSSRLALGWITMLEIHVSCFLFLMFPSSQSVLYLSGCVEYIIHPQPGQHQSHWPDLPNSASRGRYHSQGCDGLVCLLGRRLWQPQNQGPALKVSLVTTTYFRSLARAHLDIR